MNKKDKLWTVHCKECLKVLGISNENFQYREIYCLRCSKEILKDNNQQPEVKACQGEGEHTGVTQGYSENGTSDEYPSVDKPRDCSGVERTTAKEDTVRVVKHTTLPVDLKFKLDDKDS